MTSESLLREFLLTFPPDPPPVAREVADLFVVCQEGYDLLPRLAGRRWTELTLNWSEAHDMAFHMLSPAFAYYLPAILTPVLRDPANAEARALIGETLWHFAPHATTHAEYHDLWNLKGPAVSRLEERFSGLTAAQRETVARFLAWTVEQSRGDETFPSIFEEERLEYWPLPGAQA